MAAIFPKWSNRIPLMIVIIAPLAFVGLVAGVWYFFSPQFTDVGYSPKQPVPFSHALHAGEMGMDCRYCHNTVEEAAHAAVPPTATCMNCHAHVRTESTRLEPVRQSYATGEPIRWVKVHLLPDYAYFPHNAHIAAGVGCSSCHGRIDNMERVTQTETLSMGWCLDCHRNPEPHLRPTSEVTNMDWDFANNDYNPAEDPERLREVNPPQHCSGCHR